MALLNISPVPVLPRTLWLSFRASYRREDPLAIAPSALGSPQDRGHAKVAARAVDRLGLADMDPEDSRAANSAFSEFLWFLGMKVMDPTRDESRDLREALTWLMGIQPTITITSKNVERHDPEQRFTNDTRWNTFRYWATDLGFAESPALIAAEAEGIVANPSRAVLAALHHDMLTESLKAAPVWTFLSRLHAALPILQSPDPQADVDPLGPAISWALTGLNYRGWLDLKGESDAARVYLTDFGIADGKRSVSHVTRGEGDE